MRFIGLKFKVRRLPVLLFHTLLTHVMTEGQGFEDFVHTGGSHWRESGVER